MAKELIETVARLARDTIQGGRIEYAMAVLTDPHALTGVAAFYVADGAVVDKLLHTLAGAVAEKQPAVADLVKFDADTPGRSSSTP